MIIILTIDFLKNSSLLSSSHHSPHWPGAVPEQYSRARETVTHHQPVVSGYVHGGDGHDVPEHVPGDGVLYLVINIQASKESKAHQKKGQEEETSEQSKKTNFQKVQS